MSVLSMAVFSKQSYKKNVLRLYCRQAQEGRKLSNKTSYTSRKRGPTFKRGFISTPTRNWPFTNKKSNRSATIRRKNQNQLLDSSALEVSAVHSKYSRKKPSNNNKLADMMKGQMPRGILGPSHATPGFWCSVLPDNPNSLRKSRQTGSLTTELPELWETRLASVPQTF